MGVGAELDFVDSKDSSLFKWDGLKRFELTLKVGYSFAHEASENEISQQLADERERHAEDAK